ncbi:MAG TPA: HWE histidine kinase domain-containing protein [Povalibacter sp.]|nr:HWE histidine kinase domain-containing protein [Povalibacter sp.]
MSASQNRDAGSAVDPDVWSYRVSGNQHIELLHNQLVAETANAEEVQRACLREACFRVRNTLQVIIGMVRKTLHRAGDVEEFEKAFTGRIQAIGRVYALVCGERSTRIHFRELAQMQLAAVARSQDRYVCQGSDVEIAPTAALSVGLALHELAINAGQYGCWSVPGGTVHLDWNRTDEGSSRSLVIHWQESGGPLVSNPMCRGFGSELLLRQLRYELAADTALDFAPRGLEVTLKIPWDRAIAA